MLAAVADDTRTRLVLLGAGHAHLHLLRRATGDLQRAGITLTLIDPGCFWYSGLATGMLAGRYRPAADRIDPAALCAAGGVGLVRARAVRIDRERRVVHDDAGGTTPYDLLSCNLGSVTRTRPQWIGPTVRTVKPIAGLADLRRELVRRGAGTITVVGGGATGCESAACLAELARRAVPGLQVRLMVRSRRLLDHPSSRLQRRLRLRLRAVGVTLLDGSLERVEDGDLVLTDGRRLASDLVLLATGLHAVPLVANLGLPTRDGALVVDDHLRSVGDSRISAVGDCAALAARRLPRLGVFGVRQAPILAHNLRAAVSGEPLRRYRPQRRWLQVLNLGTGHGLALWAGAWCLHPVMLVLKDRLDRGFLARHRVREVG